jgi:rod shape-determining protein MreC
LKHPSRHRGKGLGGIRRSRSLARILPMPVMAMGGLSGVLIALGFILVVFSAMNPVLVTTIRAGTADLFSPALNMVSLPLQKTALMFRDVSGLAEIQAENARLIEENAKLREWYQTALMLEAENKSLKDLLNVKIEPQNSYITARILSDSASPFAKSMLVAAGTDDGVRKGQAVISGEGVVGRVVEAGAKAARVLLITDINSRVPVFVEDSRQHAIFAGDNAQKGRLVHLPLDSEVRQGARVVTSGQGGIFPVGLPVGVIEKDNLGNVTVQTFTDFSRLVHVRIVQRPEDPNLRENAFSTGPTLSE